MKNEVELRDYREMAKAIEKQEAERVTAKDAPDFGKEIFHDVETPGKFEQEGAKTILFRHKEIAEFIEPQGICQDPWVFYGTVAFATFVVLLVATVVGNKCLAVQWLGAIVIGLFCVFIVQSVFLIVYVPYMMCTARQRLKSKRDVMSKQYLAFDGARKRVMIMKTNNGLPCSKKRSATRKISSSSICVASP